VELIYGTQTEANQASMRRTLSLLDKQGLVHRERYIEPDRNFGGTTGVWGLTDKGVANGYDYFHGDYCYGLKPKTFDEHSVRTLDHELEISYFHIAVKNLPRRLYWQQTDLKRSVHPDAYFALTDPALPEGKNTFHYFLEIEKGKKTFARLIPKNRMRDFIWIDPDATHVPGINIFDYNDPKDKELAVESFQTMMKAIAGTAWGTRPHEFL